MTSDEAPTPGSPITERGARRALALALVLGTLIGALVGYLTYGRLDDPRLWNLAGLVLIASLFVAMVGIAIRALVRRGGT